MPVDATCRLEELRIDLWTFCLIDDLLYYPSEGKASTNNPRVKSTRVPLRVP